MTKKNLPIVEPKHVIEKLSIEEWLGRIKMQRYTKFFIEYLNIKYNYEILDIYRKSKIFKITLEDFMVNKEYAEEYAHVRKQYLPKKTKTKYRKDIEVINIVKNYLIIKININSNICRYLTHHGHKNNI